MNTNKYKYMLYFYKEDIIQLYCINQDTGKNLTLKILFRP